jgi:hypothetical protein
MLTNLITENTILLKFQKVAICSIFISQRAVKAWILANALNLILLILKKRLFMDFGFQKCFRDVCISCYFFTKKSRNREESFCKAEAFFSVFE